MKKPSRILLALLTLTACSPGRDGDKPPVEKGEIVFCALGGAKAFTSGCRLERSHAHGRQAMIVRHPDGGFRRFVVTRNRTGLVSADGADEAGVAPNGVLLDVRVGQDRYRFPLEQGQVDGHAR